MPVPSAIGLTKAGNSLQPASSLASDVRNHEGGRRHAGVAHQPLGHRLVESDSARERVGQQIRLVEQLAQRRHLRLARAALQPFGNGEHEVEALACGKPRGKHLAAADAHHLAVKRAQGAIELVDGVDVVELGNLLLGEAERAIVVAQIVDECDTHQRFSALAVRSAPTVPSGSV